MVRYQFLRAAAALGLAVSLTWAATLGLASPVRAASGSGEVFVVHGIAGVELDVLLDGTSVCGTVMTKTIVGPVTLAAGTHTVSLRDATKVVAEASFTVTPGSSTDLVAHRFSDATRAPTLTAFPNDLSPVAPGKSRLRIANTAAVPPADVLVNDEPMIRNLANGESSTEVLPSSSYTIAVLPTATTGPPVLGPKTLAIKKGTLTNVFAIGDSVAGTMQTVVQQLTIPTVGAAIPGQVDTGDGGQAAQLFAPAPSSAVTDRLPGSWGVATTLAVLSTAVAVAIVSAHRRLSTGRARRLAPSRR